MHGSLLGIASNADLLPDLAVILLISAYKVWQHKCETCYCLVRAGSDGTNVRISYIMPRKAATATIPSGAVTESDHDTPIFRIIKARRNGAVEELTGRMASTCPCRCPQPSLQTSSGGKVPSTMLLRPELRPKTTAKISAPRTDGTVAIRITSAPGNKTAEII